MHVLGKPEMSNLLFVFDDIWNQEYLQYLNFAKKSIATSSFKHESPNYKCIPAEVRVIFDINIDCVVNC